MVESDNELENVYQPWSGHGSRVTLPLTQVREQITDYIQTNGVSSTSEQQRYRDFNQEAFDILKKQYEVDEFEVSAEVRVVKGESRVCVFNQLSVVKTIYGIPFDDTNINFFADVHTDDEGSSDVKTRIIYTQRIIPENPNVVVISKGLADELKVNTGDRIIISRIYQDMDELDLDTFISPPAPPKKSEE